MKIEQASFKTLVDRAISDSEAAIHRPVIEKELLHYDILYALDNAGLLDELVFQGGTSLRLCYGSNRYSEDLDFAGGVDFSSKSLEQMRTVIESYIGERYGLEVTVKEPNTLREDPKYAELKIDKWQIAITTSPEQKHLPKQKIKVEVASIPAYTKSPLSLQENYDFLPDGYDSILIFTESLDEVMADKIISLPATQKYVRHRDVWDLVWLKQKGANLNIDLVKSKVSDYKIDNFADLLQRRIDSLNTIVNSKEFEDEMKRFISSSIYERTLAKENFRIFVESTLTELLSNTLKEFNGNEDTPEFTL